jgi:hypothetical protein
MLQKRMIRIVQFEYGYVNGDVHFLMKDFYEFFKEFGYVVAKLTKGPLNFREFKYSDNDFKSGPNYVAIHKDDVELLALLSS